MAELRIGDETFACKDKMPAWQLMSLAKSQKSGDMLEAMAGMHDFILGVIKNDERARFLAFMAESDMDADEFDKAIGSLVTSYSEGTGDARPTVRPSSSPSGPPATGGPSRVVSLSPATPPEPSEIGQSQAS